MGKIGAGAAEQKTLYCAGAGKGQGVIDPGVDVLFTFLQQSFIHRQDGVGDLHFVQGLFQMGAGLLGPGDEGTVFRCEEACGLHFRSQGFAAVFPGHKIGPQPLLL